mmetsp:Transcript_1994/g.2676  ORF Transcript_1994/g.2676 Transcript_1994/m.2676 type:complete len:474 (-) Transcript_1994:217-1638(-)|eukprot:CAMPEP_0175097280 /NCGR_PEP_ID=MMETSP0086_2-20121207/5198_1 /TAXON_ID=136419 /ORGANISM="Unknown Unknown, Strain D1" /LENGTH=473 /DNA_ID=CAMNT_0016370771 /DNA_START=30 /DNA_END=1451 /DNA_ORIENTATION=+
MPGKKKKGGKAKKGAKAVVLPPDEFDAMDLDQLTEETRKFTSKLNEIRRNRNYYLIERDQVQQFYDIVRDEVVKTESHVRNIESQMEKMQDTHRNDIRIYLQKVIHLEYEHANNVDSVQKLGEKERSGEEAAHIKKKAELKRQKLQLKEHLKKEEQEHEEEISSLKGVLKKELVKQREEFEENHKNLLSRYQRRLQELRDDLELRRKMEIHEIEERKNSHINDLLRNFEKAFNEMRNYYNSITKDNVALINSLNEEIEDLKEKHALNEKAMEEIERKNQELSKPLEETQQEVAELQEKLKNYDKDKISLKHARNRLSSLQEYYKKLQEDNKALKASYAMTEAERDRLYDSFEETVLTVHGKSNLKNQILEKMLDEYKDVFEVKKAQFTSVLRASNLDPVVLQNVTKKLDDVLTSKNEQIQELKYEIAKVQKAHDDLLRVYDTKLKEFGISPEELGLEPLIGATGTAPADLICV